MWGVMDVHHHDCSASSANVYMSKLIKLCVLCMYSLMHANYISIKLIKAKAYKYSYSKFLQFKEYCKVT